MPDRPHVTEAELAVLRQLWDAGRTTIRTLVDALYPGGGPSAYATVQKLLERLEAKRCVVRDRGSVPHVFAATVTRDDLVSSRLEDVAESLCEGSWVPLLTHLVDRERLDDEAVRALRSLVDRLEADPPKKDRSTRRRKR